MLRLEDVSVYLRAIVILRRVSLEVPTGQVVGLVGRNGAGKTTTLKSIMGLVPLRTGHITLNGIDLLRYPPYERARLGIGYMPEDRRLIGTLTVEENILLPLWATEIRNASDRLDWVYEIIPEIRAWARRRASQLSGGQQKLVALARSLVVGSRLLLLDEPFQGVAPALAWKLREVIRSLQDRGQTVLVTETDPKLLEGLVQTLYTIERGEIVDATSKTL